MKINITGIVCVVTGGTDTLILNTELPSAIWPYDGTATLKLEVARGQAANYAAEHFPGVPCRVIDARSK